MTLAELASPRNLADIDEIEAHAGRHPHAKGIWIINHGHLTECLSADDNLFAAMCHDELIHHSKILW